VIDRFALRTIRGDGVAAEELSIVWRQDAAVSQTNRSVRSDRRNRDDFAVRQLTTVPRRGVHL